MALARLHCVLVLLLYSKESCGQQGGTNNQNIGPNNSIGLQQQTFQRTSNNINQIQNGPNGGLNTNFAQPNLQPTNFQQTPSLSNTKHDNLQQPLNLPPNLQSQGVNNFQITKLGFSPTPPGFGFPPASPIQLQNTDMVPNGQMMQSQLQNIPGPNSPVAQMANGPISTLTLGDLVGLKSQSLLSLINAQNNDQLQQNQHNVIPNMMQQNQLTDMQKQFLLRSFQTHESALSQQGLNGMQPQPRAISVDNQQAIAVHALPPPQPVQAIVTPLGKQPPYITVQAKPLDEYLKQQAAPSATEDPIMSLVLSELSPHYALSAAYPPQKKGSKLSLKTLVPLIISLLKEKKSCGCRNCKCQNNTCPNDCTDTSIETEIAQIFGGYSNQKTYGALAEGSSVANTKNTLDNKSKINNKHKKTRKKNFVPVDTEEISDEDDSDYDDDDDD